MLYVKLASALRNSSRISQDLLNVRILRNKDNVMLPNCTARLESKQL